MAGFLTFTLDPQIIKERWRNTTTPSAFDDQFCVKPLPVFVEKKLTGAQRGQRKQKKVQKARAAPLG